MNKFELRFLYEILVNLKFSIKFLFLIIFFYEFSISFNFGICFDILNFQISKKNQYYWKKKNFQIALVILYLSMYYFITIHHNNSDNILFELGKFCFFFFRKLFNLIILYFISCSNFMNFKIVLTNTFSQYKLINFKLFKSKLIYILFLRIIYNLPVFFQFLLFNEAKVIYYHLE